MPETIEHRLIRCKHQQLIHGSNSSPTDRCDDQQNHLAASKLLKRMHTEPVALPAFLFEVNAKVSCNGRRQ